MNIIPYIFVHDQDIILSYEKHKKLSKHFKEYYYVFLGMKETDLIQNISNVIIARDLPFNIEQFPKLVTYTGWYALVKNNLLKGDYCLMLEYDVVLSPKFMSIVKTSIKTSKEKDVFSFIPVDKDFLFYEYLYPLMNYTEQHTFKQDRELYIFNGGKSSWMGSSNSIWEYETLVNFVNNFSLLLDKVTTYKDMGHLVERVLTVFCIDNNIKYRFISGALEHKYLDSHKTQAKFNNNIQKNYKDHIEMLAKS